MTSRSLLLLGLCSLVLLLLATFDPWLARPPQLRARLLDAHLESAITGLQFEDKDNRLLLARVAGHWQIDAPLAAPANQSSVRKIVQAMSLLRSLRESPGELVGPPQLVLHYSGQGIAGELEIGAASADGKHRWLRESSGGPAHLVEAHLIDEILGARLELISTMVVPFERSARAPMTLRLGDHWVELAGASMRISGVEEAVSESYTAQQFALDVQRLRFEEVALDTSLCQPLRSIFISVGDKHTTLSECGSCRAGAVRVREGVRTGCVDATAWQRLVAALDDPWSLLDRGFLPTQPVAFALRCQGRQLSVQPESVDQERLRSWWQELAATAVQVEPVPGVEAPPDGPSVCYILLADQSIAFFQRDGHWYARRDEEAVMRELDASVAELLAAGPLRFASLSLISEDPIYATRIQVRSEGAGAWRLIREEMAGAWREEVGQLSAQKATQLADTLRQQLAMLAAKRYLDESRPPLRSWPFECEIQFEKALGEGTHDYRVQLSRSKDSCLARVNEGPVAQLGSEICARVWQALAP